MAYLPLSQWPAECPVPGRSGRKGHLNSKRKISNIRKVVGATSREDVRSEGSRCRVADQLDMSRDVVGVASDLCDSSWRSRASRRTTICP